jgi:hypothetical protein
LLVGNYSLEGLLMADQPPASNREQGAKGNTPEPEAGGLKGQAAKELSSPPGRFVNQGQIGSCRGTTIEEAERAYKALTGREAVTAPGGHIQSLTPANPLSNKWDGPKDQTLPKPKVGKGPAEVEPKAKAGEPKERPFNITPEQTASLNKVVESIEQHGAYIDVVSGVRVAERGIKQVFHDIAQQNPDMPPRKVYDQVAGVINNKLESQGRPERVFTGGYVTPVSPADHSVRPSLPAKYQGDHALWISSGSSPDPEILAILPGKIK